ncbi:MULTISPECIES: acetyl-CoA carboxylase [Prauserella salsuginis group]|uniref:Biotin carboxyl carrier protein of acetyl-CoA carboxylase n=1 Tax=Prauserella salsuginis TaxID=387889 RepID=A0ABW6G167_9PSEU|nr:MULTISPECIES: acetyl-CoA carboxylase [Prauserella salsuginis group]MCR3722086.1 acetyl-CoA carboxylase biotin carboxyl carrier protein [Prauserella flava]MCR3736083.1 acetyl-CoA carboxylase biotin carboxyl carrier protein [Prauserella salsuginis]
MTTIKAQMPGVFYRRPAPEKPVYVDDGEEISQGQTIALIEVMKTFNEVKADESGTVAEFLVEDGDEVDVGQDIVRLGEV